jgi:hypothetical protein
MRYAFRMKMTNLTGLSVAAMTLALPMALAQQVERDVSVLSSEIAGRLDGFSYR